MVGIVQAGLASLLSMAALAGQAAPPTPQTDDDWELVSDPSKGLTAAAVRYDDGKAVVVQCAPVGLRVVLVGIPATTEWRRVLTATRADGRSDTQTWFARPGATSFTASVSGRDARFLRGGGVFRLRSPAGAASPIRADFDLPTQNANLDQVLTACGYSAEDERDALPRTGADLKSEWEAREERETGGGPGRPENPRSRSVTQQAYQRYVPPPPTPADISCIVRAGAFADCRHERNLSPQPEEAESLRSYLQNRSKLDPASAAANEGRVFYPFEFEIPLIMVYTRPES